MVKFREKESRQTVVARGGGRVRRWGHVEWVFNESEFHSGTTKGALEVGGGDGSTTV